MNTKSYLYFLASIAAITRLLYNPSNAQNVGISATGTAPDNSAGLDINFTNKGLLIPRVNLQGPNDGITIPSPATSLLVYNIGSALPQGYYYNAGTTTSPRWVLLSNPNNAWQLIYLDIWDQFNNTTQGWMGASVTNCAGQYMLGGHGECGSGCTLSKTYINLPPHTQVMVKVYYWKIDSHDQSTPEGLDRIAIYLDGSLSAYAVGDINWSGYQQQRRTNQSFCGLYDWQDTGPFSVPARKYHTSSTLQVQIQSFLNHSAIDESIGIVAVEVWVK